MSGRNSKRKRDHRQASKRKRATRRTRLAGQRQVFKAADAMDAEFRYVLARDEEAK